MTDKPTGQAAAAREIYRVASDRIAGIANRMWSEDDIEAIILKHCAFTSEDKVARRLLEQAKDAVAECERIKT